MDAPVATGTRLQRRLAVGRGTPERARLFRRSLKRLIRRARERREWVTQAAAWVVGASLVLLLGILLAVLAARLGDLSGAAGLDRLRSAAFQSRWIVGLLLLIPAWILLTFLNRHFLVYTFFSGRRLRRWTTPLNRVLAAVPTLIVGNAFLTATQHLHLVPSTGWSVALFVIPMLTAIALPTALQIALEVVADYDSRQLQQATALGLHPFAIGNRLLMRGIRRSFLLANTLALSRVVIEAYIVIRQGVPGRGPLNSPATAEDLAEAFTGLYSTMTVQDNIWLIVVLGLLGLLFSFWSVAAGSIRS